MRQALRLGLRARGRTSPNPLVGCVIVRGGRVVATGWHKQAGGDHAEAAALRQLGWRAPGATVYVTLEPHSFHGRTPPCTDRLIAAKVARVVVGMTTRTRASPAPGSRSWRAPASPCEAGVLEDECRAINRPYLKWTAREAAVGDAQGGGDARRAAGGARRRRALGLGRGLPPRGAPHARPSRRDPGRRQHGAARRPGADDAAAGRARPRSAARDPRRAALGAAERALPAGARWSRARATPTRRGRGASSGAAPRCCGCRGKRGASSSARSSTSSGARELLTLLVEGGGQVHGGVPRRRARRRGGALPRAQARRRRRRAAPRRRRAGRDGGGVAARPRFDAPARR